MVEPTKLKPRRFRSLLIASDSARARGDLAHLPWIHLWLASHELPDVAIESCQTPAARRRNASRVLNRRCDLQLVAHDSRIGKERVDFRAIVLRNAFGIEVVEGSTVVVALVQDCAPTQSGLRAFQNKELKEGPIVVNGNAPLLVVVADVVLAFRPRATDATYQWIVTMASSICPPAMIISPRRAQRSGYCSDFGLRPVHWETSYPAATPIARAHAGIPTLPPRIISFAVSFRPYSFSLALPSERSVEPSRETPANNPLLRE